MKRKISKSRAKPKAKSKNGIVFNVSNEDIERLKKPIDYGKVPGSLASKIDRSLATLIDYSPVLIEYPLWWMLGDSPNFLWKVLGLLGDAIFVVNIYFLANRGQTIGKYFRGIRIVQSQNGEDAGLDKLLVMRQLPYIILYTFINADAFNHPNMLILVPMSAILLDVLFIYRRDRRCLHDLIAGTKVINSDKEY
jgi:uncharacterized RDD family membrane protein YckC